MELCREWIEKDKNGVLMEHKMYNITLPSGKVVKGTNIRPHVSPEQRKKNDAIVCQYMVNVLGRR